MTERTLTFLAEFSPTIYSEQRIIFKSRRDSATNVALNYRSSPDHVLTVGNLQTTIKFVTFEYMLI